MKKYSKKIISSLGLTLLLVLPYTSFGAGAADPTASKSFLQLVQNGSAIAGNATGVTSLGLQFEEKIRTYALAPLIKVMVAIALQQVQDQTLNWIRTGFKGSGPAFIVNPNAYFKNISNQTIMLGLNSVQAGAKNNIFASSVIGTVIQSVRTNSLPTSQQLQFTLGNTVQTSICNDANITQMATQAVDSGLTVGANTQSRAQQIAQKKNDLYYQLCQKTVSDPALLQRNLTTCFTNSFSCGGWAAWNDLVSNPNNTQYGQATKLSSLLAQQTATKIQNDVSSRVNGIAPLTKCNEKNITDEDGNVLPEDQQTCIDEQVVSPAAAISEALSGVQKGANSLATSINEVGLGPLASALLQGMFVRLTNGFSSSGSSVNASRPTSLVVDANGKVISTTAPVSANGTVSTQTGNTVSITDPLVAPLVSQMNSTYASLQKVQTNLSGSASLFALYERDINSLESCYTDSGMSGKSVTDGLTYIASVRTNYMPYYATVKKDLASVQTMLVNVNGYTTSIKNNSSSDNLTKVSNQYLAGLNSGDIFNPSKEVTTADELTQYTKQITDDRNANLTSKLQQCQAFINANTANTRNIVPDPTNGSLGL